MQVGLIGLGIMGAPQARNLLKAGFALTVATRTPGKAEKFAAENASLGNVRAVETPAEVASMSE
ncbi:MAG: NAD(P)-binding domain-containing protein, partial [Acidobacteriota bacterium]